MTSQSRKKRPTTAPSIRSEAKSNKGFRRSFWLRSLQTSLLGLSTCASSIAWSQQPSWSPSTFTPKPPVPNANELRPVPRSNATQATETEAPVVLRWRTSSLTKLDATIPRNQSASSTSSESMVQRAGWHLPDGNALPPNTPRNVQAGGGGGTRGVRTAVFQSNPSDSTFKAPSLTPESNPSTIQPPSGLNELVVPPAANRNQESTFELLSPRNMNQESIPQPPKSLSPTSPNDRQSETLPSSPMNNDEKDTAEKDEEDAPSPFEKRPRNPFPGSSGKVPESSMDKKSNNPPQGKKLQDKGCQEVRDRALADDIKTIGLDISPDFAVGPSDKESLETKKQSFIQKAPNRGWYDASGQFLIDARLVDVTKDRAILESGSGSKQAVLLRDLSEPDLVYVSESWGLPVTCTLGEQVFPAREHIPTTVAYKASGLCHKPLYFEEVQLERYGHEIGPVIQPIVSTAHFFTNIAVLPYKMGIHPMNECQYTLGYYRPGSCAPWTVGPIPISMRGALMQAGAVTGAAAIIP